MTKTLLRQLRDQKSGIKMSTYKTVCCIREDRNGHETFIYEKDLNHLTNKGGRFDLFCWLCI